MTRIFAQEATKLGQIGGEGLGPFGNMTFTATTAMEKLTGALSSLIGLMTIAAAFWFFITFVIGGISWITAGGDKSKLQQARDKLTNAFIGLTVVVAGWAILALAGQFFGWTDILVPSSVIEKIKFGAN